MTNSDVEAVLGYIQKQLSSLFYGFLLICIPFLSAHQVRATIMIDYPSERAVYQRDVTGYATITVAGTYSRPASRIEVKAVPVYPGQGIEIDWQTLTQNPTGGVFAGQLRLFGGWYTILVRSMDGNNEIEQGAVSRMGIGEVFVIAGQSNAQGIRSYPNGPPAQDERVNYISNNQNIHNSTNDPDPPIFSHLNRSDAHLSPMGQGAWCWGVLGDKLVQRLNVPVLFINASWEGTSIRNWAESADNKPTYNAYGGFEYPPSMPYANLAISIKYYARTLGMRSILWMQGETDTYPVRMSRTEYRNHLQFLLNKLGIDIGERVIWTIARTSRTSTDGSPGGSITDPNIIAAQNDVLNTTFNPVYPGPETDNLGNPRPDGVHFGTRESLIVLADAWLSVMDQNYFANITPLTPTPIPTISARCGNNNSSAVLELPQGFASYRWSNGATSRTITVNSPGTYFATLKNEQGLTLVSSPVRIESLKPSTPSIIPAADPSICADSELVLSVSGSNEYIWERDGVEIGKGSNLRVSEEGVYTVTAKNAIGCVSNTSNGRKLTVLPPVATPVLGYAGPFSLLASTSGDDTLTFTYDWYRDEQLLPSVSQSIYKVSDLAMGESGVYKVQATAHFKAANGSTVSCPSGISEPFTYTMNASEDIVVFPVPSVDGKIFIESREPVTNVEITAYSMLGKAVMNQTIGTISERKAIELPLPRGIYMLHIQAQGKEYVKKIVMH
ncbi:MAG: sialate O-acetylesterase [Spirosomataceae bacterium]